MSMYDVLETTLGAYQDPAVGIAARVDELIALGYPAIPNEFAFGKWAVRAGLKVATRHSLIVRPSTGGDTTKLQETLQRDGAQSIELAFESFDADLDVLQDKLTLVQMALLMVLDGLVAYSGANGGTIIEVLDPVNTSYGEFDGTPSGTSAGFVSRLTIIERAAH